MYLCDSRLLLFAGTGEDGTHAEREKLREAAVSPATVCRILACAPGTRLT